MKVKIVAVEPKILFPVFSWLIRLFQWTKYSHYGVIVETYVIDSTIKGVVWKELKDFRKDYKLIYSWDLELPDGFDIFKWSARYSAKPYPILQNIGHGLKWIGVLKSNPFGKDEEHINCSELIALLIRDALEVDIGDSDEYDLVYTEGFLDSWGKRVSHS